MTFLTPILIAGIYAFMMWMMMRDDKEVRTVGIVNESKLDNPVKDKKYTKYMYLDLSYENAKKSIESLGLYAVLHIPEDIWDKHTVELHSPKQVAMEVKNNITSQIRNHIERIKKDEIIAQSNIPDLEKKLNATRTPIHIKTLKIDESGKSKETSTELSIGIGIGFGFILYMFIFIYGTQVMRGVMEEKTNRVVEVIISSVKPFQLMMGKILGIAMVALTQVIMWVLLTTIIASVVTPMLMPNMEEIMGAASYADLPSSIDVSEAQYKIVSMFNMFEIGFIIKLVGLFVFYFLGGYLIYSALFAAIGSAVDSEAETQQFMMPIVLPLILALYISFGIIRAPESALAFWSSMIPLTSPIVMITRIPMGVPAWELALSMFLLVATFIGITWVAAKIYRTGILMYGKKVNYKELWKWLKY